jgi:hypothetical protein
VKYMLLMQFSAAGTDIPSMDTWTPQEIRAHIGHMVELDEKLVASGEFVDGQGLAGPQTAKIVRGAGAGSPLVTEGPFAETKEFLAGYLIVDCADEDRAIAVAAQMSAAPGPGGTPLNMPIEVRPVMSAPPAEL